MHRFRVNSESFFVDASGPENWFSPSASELFLSLGSSIFFLKCKLNK